MINRTLYVFCIASAALSLSTPVIAAEAMRCNAQTKPGLFQPVLRVVSQGAQRDIALGQDGMTRKIFYRDRAVIAYMAQKMGIPATQLPSSVSSVCGAAEEFAAAPAAAPAPAAVTAPTAAPVSDGGSGDGGSGSVSDGDGGEVR